MKTIILPGFSSHNKDWAYETKTRLDVESEIRVHEWIHWDTGDKRDFLVKPEAQRISKDINEETNIIAKSVGTLVCMFLLAGARKRINKIILCGVPTLDLSPEDKSRYEVLSHMDGNHVICFQNDNDPHGKYSEVLKFIHGYNPDIPVKEKDGSDHEYPYFSEFGEFMSS